MCEVAEAIFQIRCNERNGSRKKGGTNCLSNGTVEAKNQTFKHTERIGNLPLTLHTSRRKAFPCSFTHGRG